MTQESVSQTQQSKQEPKHNLKYYSFMSDILRTDWRTPSTAIVYFFMLNRYNFFKRIGKTYFETQKDIEQGSAIPERTVNKAIKALEANGYLSITKSKSKSQQFSNNVYVVFDKFCLYSDNPELYSKPVKLVNKTVVQDLDQIEEPF